MSLFIEANKNWNHFLNQKIKDYQKFRNYDYGQNKEQAVSKLSHFISHRFLLEFDLINAINKKNNGLAVDKFLQEVYWRIYWKGWLENYPCVWNKFVNSEQKKYDENKYQKAIEAKSEITFFNDWVNELKETNYLHNHTRMWFASTWIFNLGLPWELGARLFFKYLYDGDAASNVLSWRWVGGLHTKGKKYLFSQANLRKFSNNRILVDKINYKDINLNDNFEIVKSIKNKTFKVKKFDNLLLFENDLNINTLANTINSYKFAYLVILDNQDRKIKISNKVLNFKKRLAKEFSKEFPKLKVIDSRLLAATLKNISSLDMIYPSVGENNDFINKFKSSHDKIINTLIRAEDLYSWKFATKGFFAFKKNIPKMNDFFMRNNN